MILTNHFEPLTAMQNQPLAFKVGITVPECPVRIRAGQNYYQNIRMRKLSEVRKILALPQIAFSCIFIFLRLSELLQEQYCCQNSIAIKTVLLSECQNAGLASINDSKVANNQTTLAHARHNDTNHDETVMAMHNTNNYSSPQIKCESNDAPLIWNAACNIITSFSRSASGPIPKGNVFTNVYNISQK